MRTTSYSNAGRAAMCMMCFAVLLVSGHAVANTTNSIPSEFSFEQYAGDESIVGTNGWYGLEDAMVAVATNYAYFGQIPLPGEPHDRIAKLTGGVTNMFDGDTAKTNVWLDLLIQPERWKQEDPPADFPSDAQAVLFVDTNGILNTYCTIYGGGGNPTNVWATFPQRIIDTNDWLRLSMQFRYNATFLGEAFYQIRVDSDFALTNEYGQTAPGAGDTGGSWFLCAKRDAAAFNAVAFSGNSHIDDMVVSEDATFAPQWIIKLIADEGSTMNPPGPNVVVTNNGSQTILITADDASGYELTNLWWGTGMNEAGATNPVAVTNVLSMEYPFSNVTTNYTLKSETWRPGWQGTEAGNGTAIQWLYDNNLDYYPSAAEAEMGNDDSDAELNWEEYVAGTDPNDGMSYFRVVEQGHGSPSNYVMYYITTNSGVTDAVDIYRSTNLMDTGSWQLVGDNIPRDASGTSTWWDVDAPSNDPAFYQPVVPWTP